MGFVSNKHNLGFWCISLAIGLVCCGLKSNVDGLEPPEFDALLGLRKDLGLEHQWTLLENPCNFTGITCQRFVGQTPEIRVARIVLPSKRLRGVLPPVIAQFSELRELSLADNDLFDRIPAEIGECKKLEQLNLRGNRFSSEIPTEISALVRLRALDLSSNLFSGDLQFLKLFPNLESLSVSGNVFTGKIPPSLGSFRNLRSLNLSDNNLEGPIPKSVLRFEFPAGAKVFSGNPKLCGYPLDRECSPIQQTNRLFPKRYRFAENSNSSANRNRNSSVAEPPRSAKRNNSDVAPTPSPTTARHIHRHRKHRNWVLGLFVGAFSGLLSGILVSLLFKIILQCIRGRIKTTGTSIFSPMIKKAEDLAFLETGELSSLEVIGRGGCGEVYKAELPGCNGKFIAIKRINQPPMDAGELSEEDSKLLSQRMKQIRSEIQTVGHIRHRNLLPLLAHVPRPDCHYLVYEFMKNGSLQKVLTEVAEGTRELEWQIRHKIAMGIASALEYLHMHHRPRIIHRDLKPANILLDDDLEARIADFGLAKAVPDENTHVTTSNIAGTVGYIAPEYFQTLKFTDKCDIYSFGVVLVSLVTGKMPYDDFFPNAEEMGIVKWLRKVMVSENPTRAIDSKLLGNGFEEQILLVLKVACFCVLDDPKQRPNSKEVRCMLSQIKS